MRFGSIYSNSLGILKVDWWKHIPFDERLNGAEDYDWALQCLAQRRRRSSNFDPQSSISEPAPIEPFLIRLESAS